jgi:hypothetical protein
MLILAVVSIGLCQIFALFYVAFSLKRYAEAKQADIERRLIETIADYVNSPDPKTPSKLALIVHQLGLVIGSSAAQSLRASLSQESSALTHVANGAIDQLQGQQNPILALLSGGKRGKGSAIIKLAGMLQGMLGSNNHGGSGQGTTTPRRDGEE